MDTNLKPVSPVPVTELHKTAQRPFVELMVVSSEGVPINTFSGENQVLPFLLERLSEGIPDNGFPITKREALLTLAQDIYEVKRELVLLLLGAFYTRHWNEINDIKQNLPQTAKYFFVVSR